LHGLGGTAVTLDLEPFLEAGRLVFDSPLVAERWLTYGATIERHPEAVHPVVAQAIANANRYSAADTFQALYRLQELQARAHRLLAGTDALVLPTVGTLLTVAQVEADPALNTRMGRYTYFANPLRLPAISVPAGLRSDGLPFGLSLVGLPFTEARLGALARALQARIGGRLGATSTDLSEIHA
jgi:allophanate hydrolase